MNDEELFYAWLDGELKGKEAARVEAQVAADPALQARAEQHRLMAAQLRGAFAPVLESDAPAPQFGSANVVDFQARRGERRRQRTSFGAPQWAAIAATLVVGILVGQFIGDRPGPVESREGVLMASASLDRALDTQLASAPISGPVRVGLTFRDRAGAVCRSFSGEAGSGLACRDTGGWRIEGLFGSAAQGDYRMAAGDDPRLTGLIDRRIAGEPFDAAAEKAARDRDWR